MYTSMDELQQAIAGVLRLDGNTPSITNEQRLRETSIDQLVLSAVFATEPEANLDFSVLEQTGHIVRDRYHLGAAKRGQDTRGAYHLYLITRHRVR